MGGQIDTTLDFRTDTPGYPAKDPDVHSPTLRRYHQYLWSKRLPNGAMFDLDASTPHYLHHRSDVGEFILSSDSVIPTFTLGPRNAKIMSQIPREERQAFTTLTYTIGGAMLFPGNRVDGKMTISAARSLHPRIKDRFDHTVECIRRHYKGEHSPLTDTVARYADFFGLFGSFEGYVGHFLLQDMVNPDCSEVNFFSPFDDFKTAPIPKTVEAYRAYRQSATDFVVARNLRILKSCDRRNHERFAGQAFALAGAA